MYSNNNGLLVLAMYLVLLFALFSDLFMGLDFLVKLGCNF
jgi:hypothetical protein